ncbi:hypothetical protein [Paracoccus sp. N5]|nr:hypothetical protein [Paracoccus sp. N5]
MAIASRDMPVVSNPSRRENGRLRIVDAKPDEAAKRQIPCHQLPAA